MTAHKRNEGQRITRNYAYKYNNKNYKKWLEHLERLLESRASKLNSWLSIDCQCYFPVAASDGSRMRMSWESTVIVGCKYLLTANRESVCTCSSCFCSVVPCFMVLVVSVRENQLRNIGFLSAKVLIELVYNFRK